MTAGDGNGHNAAYSVSLQFWDYTVTPGPGRLSDHIHHYWQMNLTDFGEADFYCGDNHYHMAPWRVLFIPPEHRHRIVYPPGRFGCFSFKFHLRERHAGVPQPLFLEESRETRVYIRMIQTLIRELAPSPPPGEIRRDMPVSSEDDYAVFLETMLAALMARYYRACNNQVTPAGRLRRFLARMQGRPVAVDEAARRFSYSPGHFSVLIKNETGLSAKQFIDRERMRIARHFLEYTRMNVGEVAAHMGFPDILTFCHFFKRLHGAPPATFQREVQGTRRRRAARPPGKESP